MVDVRTFRKDVSYVKIIVVFPEVIPFFFLHIQSCDRLHCQPRRLLGREGQSTANDITKQCHIAFSCAHRATSKMLKSLLRMSDSQLSQPLK